MSAESPAAPEPAWPQLAASGQVENVIVFKPAASPIKPPERVSPWTDKIDSNGQQIRQDINDSDEIEF
jgi:hypothetical protein